MNVKTIMPASHCYDFLLESLKIEFRPSIETIIPIGQESQRSEGGLGLRKSGCRQQRCH
jgi:hypothetical protein